MRNALVVTLIAVALAGCATVAPPLDKQCFHENAASEGDIGYCRAVRVGNVLYLSGTASQGDMVSAVHSVYDRLGKALGQQGLSYADVVREVVYTTDLDGFIQHKDVRRAYYGQDLPAATWVQVQRLYTPSLVVEVELTAIDRKGGR